jgi:hypothetical protein
MLAEHILILLLILLFFCGSISGRSLLHCLSKLRLSLSLLSLRDHCQLSIFLLQESLRLVELLEQNGLQAVQYTIVLVLILEVVKEGFLGLCITTQEQRDANQDALLKELVIVQLCDVLANELYGPDLNESVLLGKDLRFELNVVVGIPVSGRGQKIPVFNFYKFPDNLQSD